MPNAGTSSLFNLSPFLPVTSSATSLKWYGSLQTWSRHVLIFLKWSHIEQTAKSSIQEKKIRVLFLSAEGATANGVDHSDAAPGYGSPSPTPMTPQRGVSEGVGMAAIKQESATPERSFADTSRSPEQPQSTVAAAASSVASAIPTSSEQLKAQLEEAKATILRLKQQAEEQGLRQRKSDAINQDSKERITTGSTGMGVQKVPASGVPVQVVAGLCLLCFLIAYFFF